VKAIGPGSKRGAKVRTNAAVERRKARPPPAGAGRLLHAEQASRVRFMALRSLRFEGVRRKNRSVKGRKPKSRAELAEGTSPRG
jgi:hypothetical protein